MIVAVLAFGATVAVAGVGLMTVWDHLDAKWVRWRAARECALVDDCCCRSKT